MGPKHICIKISQTNSERRIHSETTKVEQHRAAVYAGALNKHRSLRCFGLRLKLTFLGCKIESQKLQRNCSAMMVFCHCQGKSEDCHILLPCQFGIHRMTPIAAIHDFAAHCASAKLRLRKIKRTIQVLRGGRGGSRTLWSQVLETCPGTRPVRAHQQKPRLQLLTEAGGSAHLQCCLP